MKTLVVASLVCAVGLPAPMPLLAADQPNAYVRGNVTDRTGAPLQNVVLIVETAAEPGNADRGSTRRWVRVDDRGTFEGPLPPDITIIGVLPACFEVVGLRTTAGEFDLVLARVGDKGELASGLGGSTAAFASAGISTKGSAPETWPGVQGLLSAFAVPQAPVTFTTSVAQGTAGAAASSSASTFSGFSFSGSDPLRWLSASSSLGASRALSPSHLPVFGTQALTAFTRTLGVSDPISRLGQTTWGTTWTTNASLQSPFSGFNTIGGSRPISLGRSWTTWTSSMNSSNWRYGKGIQMTATPDCARWNERE
jgi:hypothetical protein